MYDLFDVINLYSVLGSLSNTRKREVALLPSLDYKKIKADWKTLEERPKALLCQALRWVSSQLIVRRYVMVLLLLVIAANVIR